MITFITYRTIKKNRRISLPLVTFAVAYSVHEDEVGNIHVFFALKTEGEQSPFSVLADAQKEYPALKWTPVPDIGSRGHFSGAACRFAHYTVSKTEADEYTVEGSADMGGAFFDLTTDRTLVGGQTADLVKTLSLLDIGK